MKASHNLNLFLFKIFLTLFLAAAIFLKLPYPDNQFFPLKINNKVFANNEPITTEKFKKTYANMLAVYGGKLKNIQLFGGGLVMSEFDDNTKTIYAGHLGSFWAPPFFSNNEEDWKQGFNLGLVFQNGPYHAIEQGSNPQTEAFWYPSKEVIYKFYPGGGGGIQVKAIRISLPGKRGLALKLNLTNNSPATQSFNVLFLGNLKTFDTLKDGSWNWLGQRSSARSKTRSRYDPNLKMILIEDQEAGGYLAISLNEDPLYWGLDNDNYPLYQRFIQEGAKGQLDNTNNDTEVPGTAFGLVGNFNNLAPNQNKTITLIMGMGESESEAKTIISEFKNKDVETESDNYWNALFQRVFSSLPQLETNDERLNQIYLNSVLTYLVNRWPIFNGLSEAAGYGQSISLFAWMTGTSGFFPLAEPNLWKEQLKKLLSLDWNRCRAYNEVNNYHLCNNFYAYSHVSLVEAIYKYATTVDLGFLNESVNNKKVIDYLKEYLSLDNQKESGGDQLADFGHDWNLYEYTRHAEGCGLGGKYTGKVVSPNAERIIAHRQVAELAEKIGDTQYALQARTKAERIKTDLNNLLWNNNTQWFDTLSLWDANQNHLSNPIRVTFYNIVPYFLLQYEDILTKSQINGLMSHFNNFRESYGLTSLAKTMKQPDGTWCSDQVDWQGPGIYSGGLGAVLTGLYKNGFEDLAYDILLPEDGKGYTYLAEVPYFSQSFFAYQPVAAGHGAMNIAYLEGVSLAQSIIEGMFGFSPNTKQTKIYPHVPRRLLTLGPVSLRHLNAQTHSWDITVRDLNNQEVKMVVGANNPTHQRFFDHFRFEYGAKGNLKLKVENLIPHKEFLLQAIPSNGENPIVRRKTSNNEGILEENLNLNGLYLIKGNPAFCLSCFLNPERALGNANCDGKINGIDFGKWLVVFQNPSASEEEKAQVDFNCQEEQTTHTIDLEDFRIWARNY